MKKSKRLSLVLAMVMALSLLAGCGGNDSGKDAPGGSAPPAQTGKDTPVFTSNPPAARTASSWN